MGFILPSPQLVFSPDFWTINSSSWSIYLLHLLQGKNPWINLEPHPDSALPIHLRRCGTLLWKVSNPKGSIIWQRCGKLQKHDWPLAMHIVMSIHESWMTIFPILNDEQMSNKVRVEHQPVGYLRKLFVVISNHITCFCWWENLDGSLRRWWEFAGYIYIDICYICQL